MALVNNSEAAVGARLRPAQLAATLYLAALYGITVIVILRIYDWYPFGLGDWLINFQAGFVRRGLPGEVMLQLSRMTGLEPGVFVAALQIIFYGMYFLFSGLLLLRQRSIVPYILLLISPFLFLFQLHDFGALYRKEITFVAVFSFAAWAIYTLPEKRANQVTIAVLLTFPLVVHAHEMLAMYLPYMLAAYALRFELTLMKAGWLTLLAVPSGLTFLLSSMNKGNLEQALTICQSLGFNTREECPWAILGLRKTMDDGAQQVAKQIDGEANYLVLFPITVLLTLVAFVPARQKLRTIIGNPWASLFIASSLIGSIPLFIYAQDWGRFWYCHLVSLFLVVLVAREPAGAGELPERRWLRSGKPVIYIAIGLFCAAYAALWYLPHCCDSPFISDLLERLMGQAPTTSGI